MEIWLAMIVSLLIVVLLSSFNLFKKKLPPGPPIWPLVGNLIWLRHSFTEMESVLHRLMARYGPLMMVCLGPRKFVMIGDRHLAHLSLIQNGAIFSDRPAIPVTSKNLNRTRINNTSYGPTWRILRRNLAQEILHPARLKDYSTSRRWVLSVLMERLVNASKSESSVIVIDHFRHAMFCQLAFMCFGDKIPETQIEELEYAQRRFVCSFLRFELLNLWPRLGKILFRSLWKELLQVSQEQDKVFIPLIRSRIQAKQQRISNHREDHDEQVATAYVDTLVDLQFPEENRKLDELEIVSLCSEFLNAGTDTTSTTMQWLMANLVKNPHIQAKLYDEIVSVVGYKKSSQQEVIGEEDAQRMPYLKAVVLETLRLHPPGHFLLHHKVTQDVELGSYLIPPDATVNVLVADIGRDPNVWEDPMEFKPERFLPASSGEAYFDLTGNREIKMMPFGAGRRMCPASTLAILHLEYFVANLIWNFKWIPVEGDEVDLTEKQEFTTVMKNPLRARISSRI